MGGKDEFPGLVARQ